jgi:hypothetical protein
MVYLLIGGPMYKLVIFLKDEEADALRELAQREYRDIRFQASLILKEELIRCQLLPSVTEIYKKRKCAEQRQVIANKSKKEKDHEQSKEQTPAD